MNRKTQTSPVSEAELLVWHSFSCSQLNDLLFDIYFFLRSLYFIPVWNSSVRSFLFFLVFSKGIKVPVRNSQEASFTSITKFKSKGSHPQELIVKLCSTNGKKKCFQGNFLMSLLENLSKKNFFPAD